MLAAPGCRVCWKVLLKNPFDFGWKITYDLLSWGRIFTESRFSRRKCISRTSLTMMSSQKTCYLFCPRLQVTRWVPATHWTTWEGSLLYDFEAKSSEIELYWWGWASNRKKYGKNRKFQNLQNILLIPFGRVERTFWSTQPQIMGLWQLVNFSIPESFCLGTQCIPREFFPQSRVRNWDFVDETQDKKKGECEIKDVNKW